MVIVMESGARKALHGFEIIVLIVLKLYFIHISKDILLWTQNAKKNNATATFPESRYVKD